MDSVKLAVIGLGNIGTLHMNNIATTDKVELAAVCDIVPEKAQAAAEQYGCPAYTDSDELLRDRICDAVRLLEGNKVTVALRGQCVECPASAITLKHAVESKLREFVAEELVVEEVR